MRALVLTMCMVPVAAYYNLPELGAVLIMSGMFFVRVVTNKK